MSDRKYSECKRRTILVREDVYNRLTTKGKFGESFSGLIARILDEIEEVKSRN